MIFECIIFLGNLWTTLFHLQGHKHVTISEPNDKRRKTCANNGKHSIIIVYLLCTRI